MDTGDYLEWSGLSELDTAIMAVTKQRVNHSSLLIKLISPSSGICLQNVEALGDGVNTHFLSTELQDYDGKVIWYQLKDEYKSSIREIEAQAFRYAGRTGYNFGGLGQQLVGKTIIREGEVLTRLFCSEFVFYVLGGKGEVPVPGEINNFLHMHKDGIWLA